MLVLLFLSEQCSQNNSPIIKTNPFKVTKCKKNGGYLGQSGRIKDKDFSQTKIHITNIQIKQTLLYCQV